MNTKYIFVVGGVYSGTGKGISCASLGLLMKMRGHSVQCIKFDPYLNTSASVLAPSEHGEVWVTEDGWECDLDIGSYERITGISASRNNIYTSGELYQELIQEHEDGKFMGQTIQVIPHFVNKFKEKIANVDCDICIVELGGTVGDIESAGFYQAIRSFRQERLEDTAVIMVAPVLWVPTIREFKTKPLQNSIKELQREGIQADILLCRSGDQILSDKLLDKISNLTNVPRCCVFSARDVTSIYEVPLEFYNRHIDDLIVDKFHLKRNGCRIHKYRELVEKYVNEDLAEVSIAIVGKYDNCDEAYVSLKESLYHAGVENNVKVVIKWIKSDVLEEPKDMRGVWKYFEGVNGVIVPGGFDNRGIEGKIRSIQYAREKKIPFLGICLGLQCAVIEFARHVCDIEANSEEFDSDTKEPVVHFVLGQENVRKKSGTMRLGAYDCELVKGTLVYDLYGKKLISERHRHRYEVNEKYVSIFSEKGLVVSGHNPETGLVEMMELKQELHPYFVGTQAHPEFKSRLGYPAPLFNGLIKAAASHAEHKD